VKVRREQKPGDYSDPGWFKHPPGTVAYEFTGALPDAPRASSQTHPAQSGTAPRKEVEVRIRKPAGGHSGHSGH
jgi:manganese oxidase